MEEFRCTKCGNVQRWERWSDKDQVPLKCLGKCQKLTLHQRVKVEIKPSLVQQDCPVGG